MVIMTRRAIHYVLHALAAGLVATGAAAQTPAPPEAADLVRQAVVDALGVHVDIDVLSIEMPATDARLTAARPDATARLGRPMRFTLVTEEGRTLRATVELRVVADHVVVRQPVARSRLVGGADVESVRAELVDVPLRRLPPADQVVGARALRPLETGQVIQAGLVQVARAVEAGSRVTVDAPSGAVEVTATMVAADAGNIGDVIRVSNPDSRRVVKGRIVARGRIEVIHEQ
jgi:flagella basal body P-ring formation protein FlgA